MSSGVVKGLARTLVTMGGGARPAGGGPPLARRLQEAGPGGGSRMETLDNNTLLMAGIAVVALILLVLFLAARKRRSDALRSRFGGEYDQAVQRYGTRSKAERELAERERRFQKADIRPLSDTDRSRYLEVWQMAQARFVDSPAVAVAEADRLIEEVMRLRGYPVGDTTQRMADVAIGHPHLADHYRRASDYAHRSRGGQASTEDLRQAFVHYRALFDELLGAR
jgi:hypothetical protein